MVGQYEINKCTLTESWLYYLQYVEKLIKRKHMPAHRCKIP